MSEQLKQKKTILYVEDYDMLHTLVRDVLKSSIVVSALSGETAIDIINTHPPFDLILLGINLGKGMNGIELCSVIKSNKKYHNTPIIAITALDFDKIYDKVNNAMFTAYIQKPYKITDLLSIQSRYLEVG